MILDARKMITTDLKKANEIATLYRKTDLNSFEFAKKYFSEYPYRFVKNTIDFTRLIEWKIPFVIKEC